ncbi:hypothetical protein B0H13DRAFT_1887968 [Mycena leptocephala]|nr:hypothetical protein B0H13DRAFT_1887968 [Mycena leptocephala]
MGFCCFSADKLRFCDWNRGFISLAAAGDCTLSYAAVFNVPGLLTLLNDLCFLHMVSGVLYSGTPSSSCGAVHFSLQIYSSVSLNFRTHSSCAPRSEAERREEMGERGGWEGGKRRTASAVAASSGSSAMVSPTAARRSQALLRQPAGQFVSISTVIVAPSGERTDVGRRLLGVCVRGGLDGRLARGLAGCCLGCALGLARGLRLHIHTVSASSV